MTFRPLHGIFGLGAVFSFAFASGVFGCSSTARFPICQEDADCADQATTKLCFDHRCVQCRGDNECPDGFCERKVGECRTLKTPGADGAASAAPVSESPEPETSAAPSAAPKK